MTQAFRTPGATNIHPMATQYVIGFIREKGEFPVNRYCQVIPAPAPTFFYHRLERDQMARVRNLNDHVWAESGKRPQREDNFFTFREEQAFCVRYNFNTKVGNNTLRLHTKQWGMKQIYLKGLASQAMTARTNNVVSVLTTAANWSSTNKGDANTLNGGAGTWDLATDDPSKASYNAIRKSINAACNQVYLQTNGRVRPQDLRLIIGPEDARKMAASPEIANYMKYSGLGVKQITDYETEYNERFGLPARLYGVEVVVEDTPWVYDLPTAAATAGTTSRQFAWPEKTACIISRPGALDGVPGPSFSTLQVWYYGEQMTIQEFVDAENDWTTTHCTDYYVPILASSESGYLITNITS